MNKRIAKKVIKDPKRYHPHQIAAATKRLGDLARKLRHVA